jgi:hypothetical protein
MDRWEEYVAAQDAALLRRAALGKQPEERDRSGSP